MGKRVSIEKDGHVAIVKLNRPDKLNALDIQMFDALIEAGDILNKDESVRSVVICGEGKAFCAGLDLSMFSLDGNSEMLSTPLEDRTYGNCNKWQKAVWIWRELQVPVIAVVHGVVFGGGLQIMLAADIKFAEANTKMAIMEMKWGIIPDMGGPQLMRHSVREDIIRELTYTNRIFSGKEAVQYGFVTHVSEEPFKDALALAKEIATKSPSAIVKAKKLFNKLPDLSVDEGLLMESKEQAEIIAKKNQLESVFAGIQKRNGNFENYRDKA